MSQIHFDLAALRSLVTGMELGSFARAADRVGRSSSAVSAQIKLEEQAGIALFRKEGRGTALTDAGEVMLAYARRLLELNDEAAVAVRGSRLDGGVRLGLQEEFGEAMLPEVLGRFTRAHPRVRVEAAVARNADLLERIATGRLDGLDLGRFRRLRLPPAGRGRRRAHRRGADVLDRCPRAGVAARRWRAAAAAGLRPALPVPRRRDRGAGRAGIAWRVVFTSPSPAGLWAAAAAGLGVTVRTRYGLPASVCALDAAALGLPRCLRCRSSCCGPGRYCRRPRSGSRASCWRRSRRWRRSAGRCHGAGGVGAARGAPMVSMPRVFRAESGGWARFQKSSRSSWRADAAPSCAGSGGGSSGAGLAA